MKQNCRECYRCPHGKHKFHCAACKSAREGPPSAKRIEREPETSPETKFEPNIKQEEPERKQETFTMQGAYRKHFGFDV